MIRGMKKPSIAKLAATRAAVNLKALQTVTKHFVDRAKMGAALGVSRSYTAMWDEVPHKFVRQLSALTGMPPEEILPDPFPYPTETSKDEKAEESKGRKPAKAKG